VRSYVLDTCPGAIAPGGKNETAGDLSLTPLFRLLAIHSNQSKLVYEGLDSCHQRLRSNWTLSRGRGRRRNLHMRDESLKFVGDAHPGAVIGTD